MKTRTTLFLIIAGLGFFFTSCADREFNADVEKIADAMCKNIGVQNELRKANPMDTASLMKLEKEAKEVRIEMTILYQEFNQKYGEKAKDEKFNKKFARHLREAMLDCPNMSAEDKEQFKKELEE